MKGTDLYTRLQNFGDLDPTNEQVISWLDTWQKDIAADLPPVKRLVINGIVANTEIALPIDFISLEDIRESTGIEYKYIDDINITSDNYISFPYDAISLTIIYNHIPATLTSLDTDLVVHPMLQPIALYYLISMYYDKEGEGDEESAMAARWAQTHEYKKNDIIGKIKSKVGDTPVPTKDVMTRTRKRKLEEDDYFE